MGGKTKERKDGGGRGEEEGAEEEEEEEEEDQEDRQTVNKREKPRAGRKDQISGSGKKEKTRLAVPGLDPGTSGIFSAARSSLETSSFTGAFVVTLARG